MRVRGSIHKLEGESGFLLTGAQRARLLTSRAAWEEGEDEERLERLHQQGVDTDTVRAFNALLRSTHFAEGNNLTYSQMAQLLALVRAIAPNPNLDARLLRQQGEPEAMNSDLRALLFGSDSLVQRLQAFLFRRSAISPVGGQTALQLLCVAQPDAYPLITPTGLRALALSPAQRRASRTEARRRFDLPDIPNNDPVLRILGDLIVYEAICEALNASDYIAVHRLLTRGIMDRVIMDREPETLEQEVKEKKQEKQEDQRAPEERRHPWPLVTGGSLVDAVRMSVDPYPSDTLLEHPVEPDLRGYSQTDLLTLLEQEVALRGFTYPPLTLRNYYLALQSKPFVLLSGLSGTGKTRLTSLFTEVLTGATDAGLLSQYRIIPVRPDWVDSAPIVGYMNMLVHGVQGRGLFIGTPFTDFVLRAERPENRHKAFLLCLDELNLARVEHYFAEVLSAMETANREILLPDGRLLALPPNLFLTGTLNQDESTHSLSRKVLDRANTILFNDVYLEFDPGDTSHTEYHENKARQHRDIPFEIRQALFLRRRVGSVAEARERLNQVSPPNISFVDIVINTLSAINSLLHPHGLHFAYRVRDEVLHYCANSFDVYTDRDDTNKIEGLLVSGDTTEALHENLHTALDLQLLQKVLPRLSGTQDQLDTPLSELLRYAERHHFERTALRLQRLRSILQRDGFVTFDTL